jgi:hypothetical protein
MVHTLDLKTTKKNTKRPGCPESKAILESAPLEYESEMPNH